MPTTRTRPALSTLAALTLGLALFAAGLAPRPGFAADWPTRPVRVIVPFGPGGTADTLGRIAAMKLSQALHQQFIVENKTGAGGLIGADIVAHAAPDGYTLVVSGIASNVIAPVLNPKGTNFDPMKDFTHIVLLGGPPDVLVTTKSLPVKTLKDVIALAQSKPDALSYGTPGIGTHGHLVCEMLQQEAHFKMTTVPYRGAAAAAADVVGGQVPVGCFTLTTASGQIRAGNLNAIAVTSKRRLPDWPNIPTFVEDGYPNLVAVTWFALSGPAGMKPEVVNLINKTVIEGFKDPDVQKRLRVDAIDPEPLTPAEFTQFVKDETARWAPLAKRVAETMHK
jgi:tripartite-type tricarboxylate transporter receptor subunit TctC